MESVKSALFLVCLCFFEAQIQSMKAAGDANRRTASFFFFFFAVCVILILTSHFDIDIIIHTDCIMLSLIDVFGENQLLTFDILSVFELCAASIMSSGF